MIIKNTTRENKPVPSDNVSKQLFMDSDSDSGNHLIQSSESQPSLVYPPGSSIPVFDSEDSELEASFSQELLAFRDDTSSEDLIGPISESELISTDKEIMNLRDQKRDTPLSGLAETEDTYLRQETTADFWSGLVL